jgi:hypothetical protein
MLMEKNAIKKVLLENPLIVRYDQDNMLVDLKCGVCKKVSTQSLPDGYSAESVSYSCKKCVGYKTIARIDYQTGKQIKIITEDFSLDLQTQDHNKENNAFVKAKNRRTYKRTKGGKGIFAKLVTVKENINYNGGLESLSLEKDYDTLNKEEKILEIATLIRDLSLSGIGLDVSQFSSIVSEMKKGDMVFLDMEISRNYLPDSFNQFPFDLMQNGLSAHVKVRKKGKIANIDLEKNLLGVEFSDETEGKAYNLYIAKKIGSFNLKESNMQ